MFLILEITENALLQKYELISVWFWMQNLNCSELINCITTLLLKSGIGHIYNNVEQCILQPKYYYQLQACSVHITTIEWKVSPGVFTLLPMVQMYRYFVIWITTKKLLPFHNLTQPSSPDEDKTVPVTFQLTLHTC